VEQGGFDHLLAKPASLQSPRETLKTIPHRPKTPA
jgi:hypothetical protein